MQALGLPILQVRKEAQQLEVTSPRSQGWLKAEPECACSQCPCSVLSYKGPFEPSG